MKKTFIWWNTGLAPVRASTDRVSPEEKAYAFTLIHEFLSDYKADFIALGEFRFSDVEELAKLGFLEDYNYINGNVKAGNTRFDTCIFYRKDSFTKITEINLARSVDDRTHKVAQQYNLVDLEAPHTQFFVFVSHWPSRLNAEGADVRMENGIFLRQHCDRCLDLEFTSAPPFLGQKKDDAYIILMGDYNDEPFDDSLQKRLRASRDRSKVKKKKRMLYNPFWKKLGEEQSHIPGKEAASFAGNHYYSGGKLTHWHTFDQMLFSSAFLREKDWHLNEEKTGNITNDILREKVIDGNSIFDHLPIKGVIERIK